MNIKISIEGHGVFNIPASKVNELLSWIQLNQSPLTEVIQNYKGELFHE